MVSDRAKKVTLERLERKQRELFRLEEGPERSGGGNPSGSGSLAQRRDGGGIRQGQESNTGEAIKHGRNIGSDATRTAGQDNQRKYPQGKLPKNPSKGDS